MIDFRGAAKIFTAKLGDRVVADEQLVEDGTIPVYSAKEPPV